MAFPESQRIVFKENPLVEVISQLTFPTILSIAAEPPAAFQERLRETYPIYERGEGPGFPPEVSRVIAEFPLSVERTEPDPADRSADKQLLSELREQAYDRSGQSHTTYRSLQSDRRTYLP